MEDKTITVSTTINAPIESVWKNFTKTEHIKKWCHASDDWHAPQAENDLRVNGKFRTKMASRDGSQGFDFVGTYTKVQPNEAIEYFIADGRKVMIKFLPDPKSGGVQIIQTFEKENENSSEKQQQGWQAILDNFKKYTESKK